MLYGQKTVESETLHAQLENTGAVQSGAITEDTSGTIHTLAAQAGVTVVNLRAEVVEGKVALWLHNGQCEVSVGEVDTLEITGPPGAETVELHIADITSGAEVAYTVAGKNEAGCWVGEWPRNAADTGITCVLAMPASSGQVSWIKFTIGADPRLGQPAPIALDPLSVVKKDG
ncbi:MAG TPA: hypothetical protein VNM90_10900 [Haliangium sp.]|nr:hypothetical protein [Haliangium sp.]